MLEIIIELKKEIRKIILNIKSGTRKYKKYMKALLKDSLYKKDSFLELIINILLVIFFILMIIIVILEPLLTLGLFIIVLLIVFYI